MIKNGNSFLYLYINIIGRIFDKINNNENRKYLKSKKSIFTKIFDTFIINEYIGRIYTINKKPSSI
jgi:hypothetical protein